MGYAVKPENYRTCSCGKVCKGGSGLATHARKCPVERARVELSRYRCFLLGLPEELAPATPREMVDMMVRYDQTLRKGFDDATCGELTRATLAAYLPADKSLGSRIFDRIERRFSKIFFLQAFLNGDTNKAEAMGVKITAADWATFFACGAFIGVRKGLYAIACRLPVRLSVPLRRRARSDARPASVRMAVRQSQTISATRTGDLSAESPLRRGDARPSACRGSTPCARRAPAAAPS